MKSLAVDDARARILAKAARLPSETVPLEAACGRVLATEVRASRDQPPFDASAMDGWAIRSQDGVSRFTVIGESAAGAGFGASLAHGEAVRTFTGAPVPDGADTVAIQERATLRDGVVSFDAPPEPGENIRRRGNDFASGALLLAAGVRLDPWRISLAAAAGAAHLDVARAPRVAILSTGEEIVAVGETPGPWQIFNSGGPALAALVTRWGGTATLLRAGDDANAIEKAAREAQCDVLVTIGGASVGDHDLVKPALERLGLSYEVQSLNMRPGKPMWFGVFDDGRRVLGLPGNPASAMVCAELFLRPLLLAMQGGDPNPGLTTARLGQALPANGPREHWMRVRLSTDQGLVTAHPFNDQDSSLVSVFAQADALLRVPGQSPALPAGAVVDILPMARG